MEIERIELRYFVEIYWKGKETPTIQQVPEKNPLLFYNKANASVMAAIRFFDRRNVIIDEEETDVIYGEPENYSPMYYFGKRITRKEFYELGMFIPPITMREFLIEKGITSIILCTCGEWITNPSEGNMTIEEYKEMQVGQMQKCYKI